MLRTVLVRPLVCLLLVVPQIAQARPHGATSTTPASEASTSDETPATSTPAPKPAPPTPPGPPPSPAEPPKFQLHAMLGGGVTTQDETQDNEGLVRFSIGAEYEFADNFRAGLSFGSSFYSARYVTVGPAPDGSPLNRSQVSEQRYDLAAGVSYRLALASDHLEFEPWLGLRSYLFRNAAAPTNVFGVAPDVLVRVKPTASVAIEVNGGYTYNLITPPTSNALGRAQSMGSYGIAGRYYFTDTHHSVRLGFVGDVLTYAHVYRLYDTVELTWFLSF